MNTKDIKATADKLASIQLELKRIIREAIEGGVTITAAAKAAGVSNPTIYAWMRELEA